MPLELLKVRPRLNHLLLEIIPVFLWVVGGGLLFFYYIFVGVLLDDYFVYFLQVHHFFDVSYGIVLSVIIENIFYGILTHYLAFVAFIFLWLFAMAVLHRLDKKGLFRRGQFIRKGFTVAIVICALVLPFATALAVLAVAGLTHPREAGQVDPYYEKDDFGWDGKHGCLGFWQVANMDLYCPDCHYAPVVCYGIEEGTLGLARWKKEQGLL